MERQYVGIDLHRRRSTIVRMVEAGEVVSAVNSATTNSMLRSARGRGGRSAAVAEIELTRAGVTAAAVASAADLCDDKQLRARNFFQSIDRPATATYRYPGWPMRFSFGPARPHAHAAPVLGEHTEELLELVLQLSPDEIEQLRTDNVIGTAMSGYL